MRETKTKTKQNKKNGIKCSIFRLSGWNCGLSSVETPQTRWKRCDSPVKERWSLVLADRSCSPSEHESDSWRRRDAAFNRETTRRSGTVGTLSFYRKRAPHIKPGMWNYKHNKGEFFFSFYPNCTAHIEAFKSIKTLYLIQHIYTISFQPNHSFCCNSVPFN